MICQPDLFGDDTPVIYNITGVGALTWKFKYNFIKKNRDALERCENCNSFYEGKKCQAMGDSGVKESWVHWNYGCDEFKRR